MENHIANTSAQRFVRVYIMYLWNARFNFNRLRGQKNIYGVMYSFRHNQIQFNISPFHPQTNRSLDKLHRTLAEHLKAYHVNKYLNARDDYLDYGFIFIYNFI